MKPNEAPEKIYISPNSEESTYYVSNQYNRLIEYIRKDVFIKSVVNFFADYIQDNCGGYDREFVIEKFKNYMK